MNNLKNVRDTVIENGFPELMDEDIRIEYSSLEDALLVYGELTEEGFYIEVDTSLNDAPKEVIEGGIAHELSHILIEKLQKEKGILDRIAYRISPQYRILDERNTDLLVVLRGYGSHLLSFLKYSEERGYQHYKEDGLSIREIKQIMSLKNRKKK